MAHSIAIVEDDDLIRIMVSRYLAKKGIRVREFASSESFLRAYEINRFDLIILDILLPGRSGGALLRNIRSRGDGTPVLMLTVKSDVSSRIQTLEAGADDHMAKPFNLDELLARVRALIRRSQGARHIPASETLIINGRTINLSTRRSESNLGEVTLSDKEIRLLRLLTRRAGRTLSRADILEDVWGMDVAPTPRTVDNFILRFRKLYEDNPERPRHFLSVRGRGYRFED